MKQKLFYAILLASFAASAAAHYSGLFVAPVLVLVSRFMGNTMNIVFTTYELAAIGVSAVIAKSISQDGSTNWYEGVLLIVVYILLGIAFFLV